MINLASLDAFGDLVDAQSLRHEDKLGFPPLGNRRIAFRTHRRDHGRPRMTRKGDGALSNSTDFALHEDDAPRLGAGDMHGAMSRDAGNAQASSLLERASVRRWDRLAGWNHDAFGGRAEGTVSPVTKAPGTLAHA